MLRNHSVPQAQTILVSLLLLLWNQCLICAFSVWCVGDLQIMNRQVPSRWWSMGSRTGGNPMVFLFFTYCTLPRSVQHQRIYLPGLVFFKMFGRRILSCPFWKISHTHSVHFRCSLHAVSSIQIYTFVMEMLYMQLICSVYAGWCGKIRWPNMSGHHIFPHHFAHQKSREQTTKKWGYWNYTAWISQQTIVNTFACAYNRVYLILFDLR
jgi:hypothetical protein